jgi:hypothetical protein
VTTLPAESRLPAARRFSILGRLRPLADFYDRRLRERLGMRTARLYAFGLAVTYGVLAALTAGAGARAAREVVMRELVTASWVLAGLASLSLATNLARLDAEQGVTGLLAQRGTSREELGLARWFVGARRIAVLMGASTVAVCAAAALRVRSLSDGLSLLALAVASVLYALVLGASSSALARAAATLAPSNGRAFFVALILVPHAARSLWPDLPSVPAVFSALLRLVARAGGLAS